MKQTLRLQSCQFALEFVNSKETSVAQILINARSFEGELPMNVPWMPLLDHLKLAITHLLTRGPSTAFRCISWTDCHRLECVFMPLTVFLKCKSCKLFSLKIEEYFQSVLTTNAIILDQCFLNFLAHSLKMTICHDPLDQKNGSRKK